MAGGKIMLVSGRNTKRTTRSRRKKRKYRKPQQQLANHPISRTFQSSPLPLRLKANFRYNDYKQFAMPGGGGLLSWIYTANGLYDPDVGGTGHQPSGFDQLMLMYDHYCVIACKITVTFVNTSNADLLCGIACKDSLTPPTDQREEIESGNCVYSLVSPFGCGNNQVTLTYQVNLAKFLGISKILSSDKCQGNSSNNPSEEVGLFPFIYAGNTAIQTARVPTNVTLEYTAILHEPTPVGLS